MHRISIPLGHIKVGLGLRILPYQEMRSSRSLCWVYHLCGVIFLVSGLLSVSLFCLSRVSSSHICPQIFQYFRLQGQYGVERGKVLLLHHQRGGCL